MLEKEKLLDNLIGELKRGTLVLGVLLCVGGPTYGYALVQSLQSKGIDIEQNTLYPLLRRLEKQGLLSSTWDTTDSRPRKYYTISPLGKEILTNLSTEWARTNDVIEHLLKEATNEDS